MNLAVLGVTKDVLNKYLLRPALYNAESAGYRLLTIPPEYRWRILWSEQVPGTEHFRTKTLTNRDVEEKMGLDFFMFEEILRRKGIDFICVNNPHTGQEYYFRDKDSTTGAMSAIINGIAYFRMRAAKSDL